MGGDGIRTGAESYIDIGNDSAFHMGVEISPCENPPTIIRFAGVPPSISAEIRESTYLHTGMLRRKI